MRMVTISLAVMGILCIVGCDSTDNSRSEEADHTTKSGWQAPYVIDKEMARKFDEQAVLLYYHSTRQELSGDLDGNDIKDLLVIDTLLTRMNRTVEPPQKLPFLQREFRLKVIYDDGDEVPIKTYISGPENEAKYSLGDYDKDGDLDIMPMRRWPTDSIEPDSVIYNDGERGFSWLREAESVRSSGQAMGSDEK